MPSIGTFITTWPWPGPCQGLQVLQRASVSERYGEIQVDPGARQCGF